MNTPTRHAPHICDQVLAKIARICARLTRSTITVIIQDARMAVPATKGVQLNAAVIVAPGVIEELAATTNCKGRIDGRLDHGPVQATTTAISMAMGSHAMPTSPADKPCGSART